MDNKLASPSCANEIKAARDARLKRIWGALGPQSNAMSLCAQASLATDEAARACWSLASLPDGCAMLAVGGYGRSMLWPASDVDILILAPDEERCPESELDEAVGRLAALLWDCGLEPGLCSRRIEACAELAEADITIHCSMMERRLVAGAEDLFDALGQQLAQLEAAPFFLAKMREQGERHARLGDSPFGLEPNLKESPGCLRDLQMPLWIARAMGISASWAGLREAGLLTGGEAELAQACEARLSLLRAMLHRHHGRRDERLSFQAQAALAAALGIGMEDGKSAAAVMMDGFFSCARSVAMVNEVTLQGLSERIFSLEEGPRRELSENFYERGGLLWAVDEDVFAQRPEALFEAFEWSQKDPSIKGLGSRCSRALWRASRRVDSWFRADGRNRAAFARILSSPSRVIGALSGMAKVGLLGAYLPAFGKAETLMQHDLFHCYAVGRHSLGVARNLRRFVRVDRAHEMADLTELALGFDRYWLLYVAALFHDIAKGRGGRHEELAVVDAAEFCAGHGIQGEDKELVEFVVRWHLEMSRTSQKEDIEDPLIVERFAKLCKTTRHLDALYMFTIADMRATGPTVWSDWKGGLLAALWRDARKFLVAGQPPAAGRVETLQALAMEAALGAGASMEQALSCIEDLGHFYFLRASPAECQWHAASLVMLDRSKSQAVCLDWRGRTRALVWTPDKVGLFSKICSEMSKQKLEINAAKIFTTASGWALDSFEAKRADGALSPPAAEKLAASLLEGLGQDGGRGPAMGRCSAKARHAGSVALAKIVPAGADWLLEVSCVDRAGVLWAIASEIESRGISIKSARIATVGEWAEDVFVVSGHVLSSQEARTGLQDALAARLAA